MQLRSFILLCLIAGGGVSCSHQDTNSPSETQISPTDPPRPPVPTPATSDCTNVNFSSNKPMCNTLTNYPIGTTCITHIDELRPAQSFVGELEVKYKLGALNDIAATDPTNEIAKISEQINKPSNLVPVVYVQNELYISDKHHYLRSLSEFNHNHKQKFCVIVKVQDNLNSITFPSQDYFWNKMINKTYAAVETNNDGSYIYPAKSIAQMPDSPFRSLAGYLPFYKDKNGEPIMGNSDELFVQFKWVNAIRNELAKLNPKIELTPENFYAQTNEILPWKITPTLLQSTMNNPYISLNEAAETLDGYLVQMINDDDNYKILTAVHNLVQAGGTLPKP